MPRNNQKRTQINISSTLELHHLLRKMWAAEILKSSTVAKLPRPLGLNYIVEKALLEYARRYHPTLISPTLSGGKA